MKKLAIIFPGANYGLDSPLLYYADFIFEANGYERRHKDYEQVNFSEYDKIVFLSKSMGAVKAGEMAVKLWIDVKQMFS